MFDHVTLHVSDRAASERFYDLVLATLAIAKTHSHESFAEWDDFSIGLASTASPVTRGLHIGFAAPDRAHVDAFHRAGVDAGYRDDGAPGPRPQYRDDYYGAFLLDPDGNSAEAVHHGAVRPPGHVDHLWIRVADVSAATRFYATIAPYAGYEPKEQRPDFAHFVGAGGSFSVLTGTPTRNAHLAFPASDDATVDAFHAAATAAGYRDHGAPGEREIYHPGYYGAYVLDPDGNDVEVVNHNR